MSTFLLVLLSALSAFGKNEPIVMFWPPENPALKLTFDKFRQEGNYAGQSTYVSDVIIENLTDKQIPRAVFTVYFLDKNKTRVGQGTLQLADLDAHQSAKLQFLFNSMGMPASLTLSAKMGPRAIPLKIVSVPSGAKLKVDGQESGITPVIVHLTIGAHQVELAKEGYAPGNTPVEVTADELPGGSITVELGGLSRDTVELRDGTTLPGDVISMSMTEVVVRVDGKDETYPRNQVKKIILVERVVEPQPAVILPAHP